MLYTHVVRFDQVLAVFFAFHHDAAVVEVLRCVVCVLHGIQMPQTCCQCAK